MSLLKDWQSIRIGWLADVYKRQGDMITESQPVYVPEKTPLALSVQASKLEYIFSAGAVGESPKVVGKGRTCLLYTSKRTNHGYALEGYAGAA